MRTREQRTAFRAKWSQSVITMNNEGVTITNQELANLWDMVGGKNKKWDANLNADKKLALDHLIPEDFVDPTDQGSLTKYQHTGKTEMLFAQLCTGVSGGGYA
jgi:hypothetical protein